MSAADWLRLTLVPGIGGQSQRKLLNAFGLPEAIFAARHEAVAAVVGEQAASRLLQTDNRTAVEQALAWSERPEQHLVCLADPDYPRSLLEISDPPTLLYVRGQLDLLNRPSLAIVGSRNPTAQGVRNAEHFATAVAAVGLTVSSGLALGIDAAAHRGALSADGASVAFVGTGNDRIYPAANRALALELAVHGAIVSEFPLGTPPAANNFPRRNRLISGFAKGVLVVEATTESGSLITARLAAEQGREVFAVPGSIHSPQSRGCHRLIKQGAKLVETVADVLDELGWSSPTSHTAVADRRRGEEPNALLAAMGFDPCSIDELTRRSGLAADALSALLLQLELDGRVASLPGGLYQQLAGD